MKQKVTCAICGTRMPRDPEVEAKARAEALLRGLPEELHTHVICDPCWQKHHRAIVAQEKGN